jgi:hypothetical protein
MFDYVTYAVRTVGSERTIKWEAKHFPHNGVGHGKARRIGAGQQLVVRILAAERGKVASREYFKSLQGLP